jgi:hypothetical protein
MTSCLEGKFYSSFYFRKIQLFTILKDFQRFVNEVNLYLLKCRQGSAEVNKFNMKNGSVVKARRQIINDVNLMFCEEAETLENLRKTQSTKDKHN